MQDEQNRNGQEKQEETQQVQETQAEQFSFLQEKIKPEKKPENGISRIIQMAILGLVFGLFACGGFYALRPLVMNITQGEKGEVTIPEDEEQQETETDAETETVNPQIPVLTAENYKEMMQSLYSIAREAGKSLVSVQVSDGSEWMKDDKRNSENVTGMIAADNGWEILIVADNAVCTAGAEEEVRQWTVTFYDGNSCPAALRLQDKNRGLAVFAVNRMSVPENTLGNIKTVVWGNSNSASRGEVVIALGNMFGYDGGLGYGIISSTKYDELFADASCRVLATDIAISQSGSGVLVNQKGEVLGMIRGSIWSDTPGTTANALAISDLKPILEMLLNGERVPYIGIQGTTVTDSISAKQSLPRGMYVTQVREDSPAMYAGIQNGDIIEQVDGTEVIGTASYEKAVRNCNVGAQVKVKGKRRGNGGYVDVEFTVTVGTME